MSTKHTPEPPTSPRLAACYRACSGIESPEVTVPQMVAALREMLASASPHPTEHPAMFAAWQLATEALAGVKQP